MRSTVLLRRNLAYYWRTNLAVVLGVATAVAVLAGALVVGESVRASLRDLFLQRLGRTDHVVASNAFFREQLAEDIRSDKEFNAGGFRDACPLITLVGTATHEESGRRGTRVVVYGVDERFWKFHGLADAEAQAPRGGEALLSAALADELKARAGDALLLRMEKPSAVPLESLHGRREDLGRTVRLTVREALAPSRLGEFSVRPQQSAVRAVFVPLRLLQKNLEQSDKVNTVLVSTAEDGTGKAAAQAPSRIEKLRALLKEHSTLADLGVKLRALPEQGSISVESEGALVDDALAEAARESAEALSMRPEGVFSYLANAIRSGGREIPYSLVTALDYESFEKLKAASRKTAQADAGDASQITDQYDVKLLTDSSGGRLAQSPASIILNEWAARDLGAKTGDAVTLEYYLWADGGRLVNESAEFRLAGVVPIEGEAADRQLVPEYPGITGSESLANWDPPFPVDLSRVRPRDEDYWRDYRTTPKAFITLDRGQNLWQTRFGKMTSMRLLRTPDAAPLEAALEKYESSLRAAFDPAAGGLVVYPVRAEGLEASRGATDFGEYFLYFSFFLVASAMLLTALFFRLGIEQRLREIGILQSLGFPAARVRGIFLGEALVLTFAGSIFGMLGAYAYGKLMMLGLRTWWVGAVGTTALDLHASASSFLLGAAGGVLAALACIAWTLRSLARRSTRSLLTGSSSSDATSSRQLSSQGEASVARRVSSLLSARRMGVVFGLVGFGLLLAASFNGVGQVAGFFGGGASLLVALLCFQAASLRARRKGSIGGSGWRSVFHLGLRNATHRPGRSVLCITLIASAAFLIVAVDAFRRDEKAAALERKSGGGGYPLLAESLLPIVHDPETTEGREALNLSATNQDSGSLDGISFARFRLKPGDDASCLNLYQPREPRILAPTDDFIRANRFAFGNSLAEGAQEKENPWLLLHREFSDGAIPVVADSNSMTYVLHLKLGDDFTLERGAGAAPLRLRLVGALADSVFQGELLMSEQNFLRHFPEQEGYRFFLIDVPPASQASAVAGALEERLSDFGFDVEPTAERLAGFHRVENTFLSTFQMLGALGLVLGTVGLSAVLLRNVLERRRELALLRAFGYNRTHFAVMVIAENALLLFCGLATGVVCALLAVAPVIQARGGQIPFVSLGALLLAVIVSGMLASLVATVAALRSPLLPSLRAE
jgi:ABC-type lipoprotein release transport system permease subunit